ncbi:MAG: hypothetical protein HPY60_05690 [Candidatus Methanofastidiosum sp.]|nr:hypothetical protein [Methanofastidiosum sp.]
MNINNIIEKAKDFEKNPPPFYNPNKAKNGIEEFTAKFNYEKIKNLTLEEYVLGNKNKDTFSYLLEFKELPGVSIKGNIASKFYIYTNDKLFPKQMYMVGKKLNVDYNQAKLEFNKVRDSLVKILDYSKQDNFIAIDELEILSSIVKSKIIFMYNSEKITTTMSPKRVKKACEFFDFEFDPNHPINSNHRLVNKIKSIEFFSSWSSYKIGSFLNHLINTIGLEGPTNNFWELLEKKKQIILYGPPGTGKTYFAREYALNFIERGDNSE